MNGQRFGRGCLVLTWVHPNPMICWVGGPVTLYILAKGSSMSYMICREDTKTYANVCMFNIHIIKHGSSLHIYIGIDNLAQCNIDNSSVYLYICTCKSSCKYTCRET